MRYALAPRFPARGLVVAVVVLVALSAAGFAVASGTATPKTTTRFISAEVSPKSGSVGTKVTIKGAGLSNVTSVTWVIYSSNPPKNYSAKFTKSATTIIATAPVAWPSKKYAGYIEAKAGTTDLIISCWGACG